jgi:hypothetical protein
MTVVHYIKAKHKEGIAHIVLANDRVLALKPNAVIKVPCNDFCHCALCTGLLPDIEREDRPPWETPSPKFLTAVSVKDLPLKTELKAYQETDRTKEVAIDG